MRVLVLEPRPEHADAGRAVELVPGEDVEVRAERLHVDLAVHHRLAAVEQHLGARPHAPWRRSARPASTVPSTFDIWAIGDQPDLAVGQLGGEVVHVELAGYR